MASSLATATNWGMSFVVTLLFEPMKVSGEVGEGGEENQPRFVKFHLVMSGDRKLTGSYWKLFKTHADINLMF